MWRRLLWCLSILVFLVVSASLLFVAFFDFDDAIDGDAQHALQLARMNLAGRDTPNRQIVLITDGLPTAHYDQEWLYLLYPPDVLTEEATLREALLCKQEGITINFFLIPSWSQSEEDIRFAYRVAESTEGRVFFTAGSDLDRFVVWDYLERKREILG